MKTLTGTYVFGSGADEKIDIAIVRGNLALTRTGKTQRMLMHLGSHEFYPIGSFATRVRFARSVRRHDADDSRSGSGADGCDEGSRAASPCRYSRALSIPVDRLRDRLDDVALERGLDAGRKERLLHPDVRLVRSRG